MTTGRLEILVEPFRENDPGPHVVAALAAIEAAGLAYDMGPFSTMVEGSIEQLYGIIEPLVRAGMEAGASSIQTRLERA